MLIQLASLFTAVLSVLATQGHTKITSPQSSPQSGEEVFIKSPLPAGEGEGEGQLQITAQSAFLIDTTTGRILLEKNADTLRPIASITKLMTALVVLDYLKDSPSSEGLSFNTPITFEANDRRNGGIAYLIPGEAIMPADAWRLMLVGSSNDATSLLARITGNTECSHAQHSVLCNPEEKFVKKMNSKAKQLGLTQTIFTDPTGLDSKNMSTARESAALARIALAIPKIRDTVQTRKFSFAPPDKAPRLVNSTNWLLGSFSTPDIQIFGGKTGHIEESGYNLVFSAGNKKHELMGVVLGSENNDARFSEMKKLLEFGFKASELLSY